MDKLSFNLPKLFLILFFCVKDNSIQQIIFRYSRTVPVLFNSTLAPAASNFFLASSASFFGTAFLISLGAASTKSLASFKPSPVIALTL